MEKIVMLPNPGRLRGTGDHWPSNRRASGRLLPLLITVSFVFGLIALTLAQPAASASQFYVEPSGHTLSDPFLRFWTRHEGRLTYGFPVTEPVFTAIGQRQFFQYGVVEAQGEGEGQQLSRIPAGLELMRSRLDPDRTVAGRRAGGFRQTRPFIPSTQASSTGADTQFFEETGYAVSGDIKAYYDAGGGRLRFGVPISDPYVTAGVTVQWFEFGRIEVEPNADPAVRLAPIGFELARALRTDTTKVQGNGLPPIDLNRFRLFYGDGTIPEALAAFSPKRISMPNVGIEAAIEEVDIVEGVMGVPEDPWQVGWYPDISEPGDATNVVMAGHKDWWGIGPTIFANLGALAPGNRIYVVGDDGRGFTYEVRDVWSIGAGTNAQEIVSDIGVESLTLITCTGNFNGAEYESRLIVRAERI